MRKPLIIGLKVAILIAALYTSENGIGFAQSNAGVGIGTKTPHASAILDITSANKGVLFPRLSTAQRGAITSPASGLLIYNSTTKTLEVYDGSAWQAATPTP